MRRVALGSLLVVACFDEANRSGDTDTSSSGTSTGTSSSSETTSTSSETTTTNVDTSSETSSSTGMMADCTSSCSACLSCAVVDACLPVYEECTADETCASVIGCAMGCWAEDDPEACFALTCQCAIPELPNEMLGCVADTCGECVALSC
jgi:hypothetical protein